MKFKEIIRPFLEYKKDYIRTSSLSFYSNMYDLHLLPYFGEYTEISQSDIDEYLFIKSKNGTSQKGLANHVVALKTLFKWANKEKIFITKPFKANYPFSAREKAEITPLSVEEAKLLAKYCEENFTFLTLGIYTTLFTGLRVGEICGLQFKDIDIERGVLSVNKTVSRLQRANGIRKSHESSTEIVISDPKTHSSSREIPLPKQLLRFYKVLFKIVNPDFFVASNSLKPTEPHAIRKELARIIEVIGIPQIRVHDLRHTFATRCISMGVDPKTVSLLLGHSTVDITLKTYTHINDEDKTEAMNKLSKKMLWA